MRVIGIDPGTGSFDFFGMDGEKIILDTTVPVPEVAQNPRVLLDTMRNVFPLDAIVGPSGYGIPITPIRDMTEPELDLMVRDDKSMPLCEGIRMAIRLMKEEGFPVYSITGQVSREERASQVERMRQSGGMLVTTDVTSEGASLEFIDVSVNYDLPSQGLRVQQRLGRLLRLGRTSPLTVLNLRDESRSLPWEEEALSAASDQIYQASTGR